MAVITLAGNTIGCCIGTGSFEGVGTAFSRTKQSIKSLAQGISTLKSKIDTARVAANVDTSHTQAQNAEKREETKQGALTTGYDKLENLISDVGIVDNKAADKIRERKNDFYACYSYLKPECEKSTKEKIKDKWEGVKSWCKEHWKAIVTVIVVAVAVIGLVVLSLIPGGGILAGIIAGACWGAITGAVIGGVSSGIMSAKNGGSFWAGFENGAFSGAISGAIGGAITGGVTAALGPASTMLQSVVRGVATGSISTGTSNMLLTGIDYYAQNGTLEGSAKLILQRGISGAISGGIVGGVMGGIQFKVTEALRSYSGNSYKNINNSLRNLDTLDDANVSTVKTMHNKLSHSALPEDMTLYRGTSTDALGSLKSISPDDLVGNIITEDAFMSTSTSSSVANGTFRGNMQMVITAPKGSHGLDISNISCFSSENEVLFDYGQNMLITGAKYVGSVLHLDVTIIT